MSTALRIALFASGVMLFGGLLAGVLPYVASPPGLAREIQCRGPFFGAGTTDRSPTVDPRAGNRSCRLAGTDRFNVALSLVALSVVVPVLAALVAPGSGRRRHAAGDGGDVEA